MNCLDCKFAKWQMTAHTPPQINHRRSGECTYRVVVPDLPAAQIENTNDLARRLETSRRKLWTDSPFEHCPVWRQK